MLTDDREYGLFENDLQMTSFDLIWAPKNRGNDVPSAKEEALLAGLATLGMWSAALWLGKPFCPNFVRGWPG